MTNHDSDDGESSDDSLREEIESISRVCKPTTTNNHNTYLCSVANARGYISHDDDDDDDDDDDLELVRSIQQRYGPSAADGGAAGHVQPLATLPPFIPDDDDDDEDDDYEFYRAIKQRFSDGDAATTSRPHATAIKDIKDSKDGDHIDKCLSNDIVGASLDVSLNAYRDDIEHEPHDTAGKESTSGSASSFPRAAQKFIEAIKRNRSCQKFIRNKMLHIEARMEEINELRKRLKALRDFQVQCKKKMGRTLCQKQDARIQLITVPKQSPTPKEKNVSPMCYGPLENSYVVCFKAALERFPLLFHREKWSAEERENLEKGIVRQYQEKLLQRSAQVQSGAAVPGFTKGVDRMISSVSKQTITPEILQHFSGKVNWEQLASAYLSRRSGRECEARWLNHENQLINRDYWTADEDKRLLVLIQQNGIHDWSYIAEKLGTNRTPFQCLARYQRSLNASILKREWTADEDARLRAAVEYFGESNWQAVASELEGRTGTQCSNRWKKTLHPAREKVGKWNEDEDKRLRVAITLFGKSWHRISQFVPGRTQVQCRERWVNILDPSLKRGGWTREEDLKLRSAINTYKYCWSKVASCVPSRTDNQCRRRWKALYPSEFRQLRVDRIVQKAALISNFVDREVERPALGPSDFVPLRIEGPTNEHDTDNGLGEPKRSSSKKRKRKGISASPDTNNIGELKKSKSIKSGSKKKKHRDVKRKKQAKNYSSESVESDADIYAWDTSVKITSRRARGVRSKVNHRNDQAENWEDVPLSVLFNKPLTRTRRIRNQSLVGEKDSDIKPCSESSVRLS